MNLFVNTVPVGPLGANCHILYSDSSDKAILIDTGGDFLILKECLKKINKKAGAIILTHCHFDHVMATSDFASENLPVYMHKNDLEFINSNGNLAKYWGVKFKPFSVDNQLIGGLFNICGYNCEIIETPGHTAGSICIKVQNLLFSGDTIFNQSYGRYDFPSGNLNQLINSCKKLFALPGETIVYAGHGENTTIANEREFNPIKLLF